MEENNKQEKKEFKDLTPEEQQKQATEFMETKNIERFYKMGGLQTESLESEKEKIKRETKLEFFELVDSKKTDMAAELLVDYVKERIVAYTIRDDKKPEMWVYKNGIYIPNGKFIIKEMLRDLMGHNFSQYYFNRVVERIEADTGINSEDFFTINNKYEIPVQNGILDIRTKKLKSFTPEKIFFNKLPVTFDPEAECEKIEEFLKDILAKPEDRKVFYEIGGYCLLKENRYEKAFMFHGSGRNGKGKSIELIKRTIGIENCTNIPLKSLQPDNFIISDLFGKMINIGGDLDKTSLRETGMFKQLSSRDLVKADRKHLNPISFENFAKFIFACNELPMVYDTSDGFWERWILLDFPYKFVNKEVYETASEEEKEYLKIKDNTIIDKITSPEELSGLLNKFLEGYDRLELHKSFSNTRGTKEIKDTWIRRASSFMAFCMDKLEESPTGYISKKDIRKEFSKYCKEHNLSGAGDKAIKATLQEMFGVSTEKVNISINDTANYQWVWSGIKWKGEENDD